MYVTICRHLPALTIPLTQNLNRFQFPAVNSASLCPWLAAGLAIEANADDDSGIVFRLGWGTKEFNAFLRTRFPQLFEHLGTVNPHILTIEEEPDNVGKKRIDYSWPYILLKKDRKRYEAVDNTHPTAETFRDNLSGDGAHSSFRGKAIFFGMYPSQIALSRTLNRLPQSPRTLFRDGWLISGSHRPPLRRSRSPYPPASVAEVSFSTSPHMEEEID